MFKMVAVKHSFTFQITATKHPQNINYKYSKMAATKHLQNIILVSKMAVTKIAAKQTEKNEC